MRKLCYKVVSRDSKTGEFCSAVANNRMVENPYILFYRIGETTYPKTGRIFVFKDLRCAEQFQTTRGDWRILKGYATEPRKVKWVCELYGHIGLLNKFWKESKHGFSISKYAPCGSYTCSSFIPIEVVK